MITVWEQVLVTSQHKKSQYALRVTHKAKTGYTSEMRASLGSHSSISTYTEYATTQLSDFFRLVDVLKKWISSAGRATRDYVPPQKVTIRGGPPDKAGVYESSFGLQCDASMGNVSRGAKIGDLDGRLKSGQRGFRRNWPPVPQLGGRRSDRQRRDPGEIRRIAAADSIIKDAEN